ncbi:ABC transporter ATP-binding protein [Aneurinibacillus sp. Ricciae_BoGa-3]|uniref:ABC transporter ATP-binding protein n=1 Tax=Aneurinibacillus sp. Ricciae_BoGa-3 TaxID=3022697 RepID=UPI0023408BF6|nr:ABC transporter ATP-binding protein [Aneurinibacillus sp. Ricciae_BoGa-3]WCK53223.1 ABC transporter ATP-binding protein [Aneurinibacillus sp. Ricciae_BoGa-3]
MLNLTNISTSYGPTQVLDGISINVEEGELITLIGSNGAGKTTTLRVISGLQKVQGGNVTLLGENIENKAAEDIVRKGIAHVPEGRRVFPGLTVRENLELGTIAWRTKGKQSYEEELEKVYHLFPKLKQRDNQLGWSMSGGEQQMVAIGRALMAKPKVLLLDEPSLGLSPVLVDQVFNALEEIKKQGITILLVEQNASMALEIADRGYVIAHGKIVLEDQASNLMSNPEVKAAYLGG